MANENLGIDLLLGSSGDLAVSSAGDLVVTPDGRTCLLQDVRNLLDTLPGDLFSHAAYGAGLPRLFGEEDRPDFQSLLVRAITDALTYDGSVGPRVEPDSIEVGFVGKGRRDAEFRVTFTPIADGWTSPLSTVWKANAGPEDLQGGTP
jgi:hypothetical protein